MRHLNHPSDECKAPLMASESVGTTGRFVLIRNSYSEPTVHRGCVFRPDSELGFCAMINELALRVRVGGVMGHGREKPKCSGYDQIFPDETK